MWDWVKPQDFGAVGDGVTNDWAAFNAAITSGYPVWVPYTYRGYQLGSTPLVLGGGTYSAWQILAGDQGAFLHSTASSAFRVTGSFIKVSGFTIGMATTVAGNSPPPNSTAFLLYTTGYAANTNMASHRYSNLSFRNCLSAFLDKPGSSTNAVTDMQFVSISVKVNFGTQITIQQCAGFILFGSIYINNAGNTVSTGPAAVLAQFLMALNLSVSMY